ncbi:MAG: glycosyltransferase [Vicingus serpentipes]|nr:glycosyltransferase [Vicingus serpentipes]
MNYNFSELFLFLELNDFWDYLQIIFLVAFLVQLFFYLGVFLRLALHKNTENAGVFAPVSVIICAKNERENLLEYLPQYLSQNYPKYEVIVVNDNSVDDTADVLKAFALQHKHLKIVTVPDSDRFFGSKKFALTLGIKAAQYEHVLLTDADCKPSSSDWVKCMSNYTGNNTIILGVGNYEKQDGLLNRLIRFETFYTALQYLSFALIKFPYMGVGRNLAYHKELFFNNKGFASHQHILSGDDDLFINEVATKTNTQIVIDESAHTISQPKTDYKLWIRQKKRHFLTATHYQFKHQLVLGLLQLSQWIFLLSFIVLLIKVRPVYLIVSIFVLRYLIQLLVFKLSANKIGGKDLVLAAPFFELFFMVFNPLLVTSNLLIKQVKWN